jgi:single-strand DNA-binding protein
MAGETTLTIIGNLTADPELRFTPSGDGVANFTVASTPRTFDRQSNEWKDGETLFMRCAAWRELSENVTESLTKGTRVMVTGRLKSRSYETKEGEKRTVIELEVDEIGPSLRYATAQVTRSQRGNGQGGQQGGFGGGQQGQQGGQWQGGQQGQGGGFGGQQGGNWQGGQQGGQQGVQHYQQAAAQGAPGGQQNVQRPAVQQDDPWATPGVSNAGGWGNGPDNEPPF